MKTGKEVWSRTMTAKATPTCLLKVRKSALDAYHKDRRATDTHQAMRCFRYDRQETHPMRPCRKGFGGEDHLADCGRGLVLSFVVMS